MSDRRVHSPTAAFLSTFRSLLSDDAFRIAAASLAALILLATGVYAVVEGWSPLDSLYFSVITASTVGYGDFSPETDIGKVYTMVYVLVTTGLLVLVLSRVATRMIAARVETPPAEPQADELPPDGGSASGEGDGSRSA